MAYGARKGKSWSVVLEVEDFGPYDYLGTASGIHFTSDGAHLAFAALIGNKWCIVADGKRQLACENIGDIAYSADGKRLAYAAKQQGRWALMENGHATSSFDAIGEGTLQFSPNGRRVCFAAQLGEKWFVVVDGKPGKAYDGIAEMKFSPDSQTLAYVARVESQEVAVVGDREHRPFDRIGGGTLVFSPNSRRLGYIAQGPGNLRSR